MSNNLIINLYAQSNYIMGSMISISVDIYNYGNQAITLFKPATSSGFLKYDLFMVKKDFQEKPYHGAIFYAPFHHTITTLHPDNSINFNTSLAKEYLIDEAGKYSVEVQQEKLFTNEKCSLNNTKIYFDVYIENKPPVKTYLEISRRLSESGLKCESFGKNHCIYNALTKEQMNTTKTAHYFAEDTLAYLTNNLVEPLPDIFKPAYQALFCKNHYLGLNRLIKAYKAMHNYLKEGMKYWFNGEYCHADSYGYIIPNDPYKNLYFCKYYESMRTIPSPANIIDSKAGFIIHEISHQAAYTKDHSYFFKNCSIQAYKCEPQALKTADCVEYFAEIIAVQSNLYLDHE
jgi:hypothetical protein